MYTTGVQVNQGQFSWDVVGTLVLEYANLASTLSKCRWKIIMKRCGAHSEEQKPTLKVHPVRLDRCTLYVPSSPTKASEDE